MSSQHQQYLILQQQWLAPLLEKPKSVILSREDQWLRGLGWREKPDDGSLIITTAAGGLRTNCGVKHRTEIRLIRLVVERMLRRRLRPDEVCKTVNGDKHDLRRENVVVMSKNECGRLISKISNTGVRHIHRRKDTGTYVVQLQLAGKRYIIECLEFDQAEYELRGLKNVLGVKS